MLKRVWRYFAETIGDFSGDNAFSRGAAISFYTILSLGPLLVLCIAVAGFVFGEDAARGAVVEQLQGVMGKDSAELIQGLIVSARQHRQGFWASGIAVVMLVISATSVLGELQSALNAIWKAEPAKATIGALLRARAVGLALVATVGFLLIVSLIISAVLQALGGYLIGVMPFATTVLRWANDLLSFLIVSALFAAIYKILPDRKLDWRDVGVGAVGTAALMTIGKTAIATYIGAASVANSYGAAGTLIVVLLWIYYSCVIFLLGAEFTKVWAAHHGSREAFIARLPETESQMEVKRKTRAEVDLAGMAALASLALLILRTVRDRRF